MSPGGGENDTAGAGEFDRATLELTVTLSPEDSALASLIRIEGGVLPGATVTIQRQATEGSELTGTTRGGGVVRFEELVPGDYRVSVFRLLTAEQIERLLAEGVNATSFAGTDEVAVSAPATRATIQATIDREATSLLISEVSSSLPRLPSGDFWRFGHYAELYNNTDTLIYLDAKVLVKGFFFGTQDANETFNCESMRPWREDPAGIWTQRFVYAFPGSGGDFPLRPGEAAVIATDAIDHSQIHPGLHRTSRTRTSSSPAPRIRTTLTFPTW